MNRTFSTQHSALSTQHSALSTQHSALSLSRLISRSSVPAALFRRVVPGIALACLLAGCTVSPPRDTVAAVISPDSTAQTAALPPTENTEQAASDKRNADGVKLERVNLTPYTTWSSATNHVIGNDENFSDAYTRLIVIGDMEADASNLPEGITVADYPYKPRLWLSRLIAGSEFSINFTAKLTVGSFEETVPLVTVGHQSNSDGEKWDRIVYHSSKNHPLFLVRRDGHSSSPAVKISMHGSKSYTSRGASSALQVAIGVANAVAPTSSVVTRLSEQTAKDHSRALDTAISKLFGTDVTEEHYSTPDFYSWSVDEKNGSPAGIRVELRIPPDEKWDGSGIKPKVGTWTITFDNPRPSIFSDWRICKKDRPEIRCVNKKKAQQGIHGEIDASEVLNYTLLDEGQSLGTIRAYLAQQDWFGQAQTALVAANTAIAPNAATGKGKASNAASNVKQAKIASIAGQMCRRIRNAITGLDLNGFDADIVVWAVMKGMPWPEEFPSFDDLKKSDDCGKSINHIETAQLKNKETK